jgi:hypothetical protein
LLVLPQDGSQRRVDEASQGQQLDLGAGYFDRRDSTKIAIVFDVGSKQPAA